MNHYQRMPTEASRAPARLRGTAAFTLIELSIVLVIIGLIVGGVLVGQDLIRAAANRSVISDIEKFKTAVLAFRGKYDCFPGDCPNATTFFGASPQCGYVSPYIISNGTCNGNGNGQIAAGVNEINTGPAPNAGYYQSEDVLFWQQLGLAGMIPGSYTALIAGNPQMTFSNVPFSKSTPAACYYAAWSEYSAFAGSMFSPHAVSNIIEFGSPVNPNSGGGTSYECGYTVLTPAAAYNIDSKIDDGQPFTGIVTTLAYTQKASGYGSTSCATGSGPYQYVLSTNTPVCQLLFQAGF